MIIDSHIYLFTPIDSPEGPNKSTQRIRWAQSSYSGHHQPAWRIKDHQVSDSSVIGPKTPKDILIFAYDLIFARVFLCKKDLLLPELER